MFHIFQAVRPDGLRISCLLLFIPGAVGFPTAARPHHFITIRFMSLMGIVRLNSIINIIGILGIHRIGIIGTVNIIITGALTIDIIVPFAGFRSWFALWLAGEFYIRRVLWLWVILKNSNEGLLRGVWAFEVSLPWGGVKFFL